ncbi:hypothetical protein PVAP13_2NG024800 [Panicum virgatum]|uniref:Alpha/beta hydrolase fold-3 domain-containing protein n=1 Tax=Panicum virgatum TaxID=38727 RepID=A0A8T0V3U6_PANVG|nr:hypothetical protein PVAP13_2NG024800 [Panicum virgatum]
MHANKDVVAEVDFNFSPFLKRYKDGRIERLLRSPLVAASENPTANSGVATRDVVIDHDTGVSARLFLPSRAATAAGNRRLPLVVYIHGGSCTESAFCQTYHRYATSLAASTGALIVSVEYRLALEHPIPAPTTTHDRARTFLAGDSAGGNIAYHTAVRASQDGGVGVDIEGMVTVHPYFWGAERLPSEEASNDDPRLNPPDEEIASLRCRRVLVAVAEKDTLQEHGCLLLNCFQDYYARTGGGEATLVESEGEDHGFHLYSPLRASSKSLMASIELDDGLHWHACDGKKIDRTLATTTAPKPMILGVPRRPFMDVFGFGMEMKRDSSGHGNATASKNYGLFSAAVWPNKAYKGSSAVLPRTHHVIKNIW